MTRAALILLLMALVPGCDGSAPPKTVAPLPVRLAYVSQHDCVLVHLAMAKGYFTREGLAVEPQLYPSGREALGAVLAGKADLATVAEAPFMFAALRGEKIAVVASIFSSSRNIAIIANRERGISRPADLRGKRIGIVPGTTTEIFLDFFLTANGLARREVTTVPLKPDEMLDAITTGRVDAASAWNPVPKTFGRRLGANGAVFHDTDIYTESFLVAGRRDFIAGNPEAMRRVVRALLAAEAFAADHAADAQALVAAALKMDAGLLSTFWSESRYRVSLDQSLLISLEDESRWARKSRLVPGASMPNYLDYISIDALQAARPEAITITR